MKRVRGISIDRDVLKSHFEPLLLDGKQGPITYSRFVRYVSSKCPISVNSLKELWMGRTVDESTLKRLRAATGVDLQSSPDADSISLCIARLGIMDQLMAGCMFAPASVTAHIESKLDDLIADLHGYSHINTSSLLPTNNCYAALLGRLLAPCKCCENF